jgi:hypothetical protein
MQTTGTKGSDVYTSTGDPRLDLSVNCVRGTDPNKLSDLITAVLALGTQEALEDAFVLAFHTRNIRGGKGERDVFYALFARLFLNNPDIAKRCLPLVSHYGCWNDLFVFTEKYGFEKEITELVIEQFKKDMSEPSTNSISLLAKWAPREHKFGGLMKTIAHKMFPEVKFHSSKMKKYRQMVAKLNKRLQTVEIKMCENEWDTIEPAKVPGRAGKLYNRVFLNLPTTYKNKEAKSTAAFRSEDPKRIVCREHFLEHIKKALEGHAKVHGADTVFPHEVIRSAITNELGDEEKDSLRAIWKGMVEKARSAGGLGRSIFMSDFSGSMTANAGGIPYLVSMALGILGSEVCSHEFQNKLMTFDSNPIWHTFTPDSDLFSKIKSIKESGIGQGLSTDFQKAMDLVLQTLKESRTKPGQEPQNLIVLTDMNWDMAYGSSGRSIYTGNTYRHIVKTEEWQTHIEMMKEAFKRAGEDMWGVGNGFTPPRIVIWNLAASSRTDYHATDNTPGVTMLSGWSPTQFEVLQRDGPREQTPYEVLRSELDHPRYEPVRAAVRTVTVSV